MMKPRPNAFGKGFTNSALDGAGKLPRNGCKNNLIPTPGELSELLYGPPPSEAVIDRLRRELFPPPMLSLEDIRRRKIERESRQNATREALRRAAG